MVDAKLTNLVTQRLIGNDPSTNYQKYIKVGGTTAGWFQLTNNGVNVIINGTNTAVDGTQTPTALQVVDTATNNIAQVTANNFALSGSAETGTVVDIASAVVGSTLVGSAAFTATPSAHPGAGVYIDGGAETVTVSGGSTADHMAVLGAGTLDLSQAVGGNATHLDDTEITNTDGTNTAILEATKISVTNGSATSKVEPTRVTTSILDLPLYPAHSVLLGEAGDVAYAPNGTTGQILTSNGAGVDPSFQAPVPGDPTNGLNATIPLAKLTTLGANGSVVSVNGILQTVGYVAPI